MSPWIPVQDISLAVRPANGACRTDSQSRTARFNRRRRSGVRFRDGRSELNYAIYHDRYQRTGDGWKFTKRVYEVRYHDQSPLAGSGSGPS